MNKTLTVAAVLVAAAAATAQNIPNPLLPNVADIGVLRYNGKYYLGGCRTDGDFYISSDLVNWQGPVHVIDMDNEWSRGTGCGNNQIHSNDMVYDNGTIHAYWSVNYWGHDINAVHVVHSEASDPMGPYSEPDKSRWMDSRIDPKIFRDDDGSLYMYMVRFTEGNSIWGRRMKNYREFDTGDGDDYGEGFVNQFSSLHSTWERADNVVAEGPWVIKYHGKYYMMYNANHSGGEWGNYQLGVAQANHPLGFNNSNKYSYPVVTSNQKYVADDHIDVLKFGTGDFVPEWAYTSEIPSADWKTDNFDDRAWKRGRGGFARRVEGGTGVYPKRTDWQDGPMWFRKTFNVNTPGHNYALRITHRGPCKAYINGELIYSAEKDDYRVVNLTPEQAALIHKGENIFAAEGDTPQRGRYGAYFNAELFDYGTGRADEEIVTTPGQPNILRGPNGFEWWLIYMGNHNDSSRDQYIDRVHFHGDRLTVDGMSHRNNSGYHPVPALPAYGDTFDSAAGISSWTFSSKDAWKVADGELCTTAPKTEAILSGAPEAVSYLFEIGVKPKADAGIYAIWIDKKNNLSIGFDSNKPRVVIKETVRGKTSVRYLPLRSDFRFDAYHPIRIERDANDIVLYIDEMRYPDIIETSLDASAVPGLYASASGAAFDGAIYSIGFDDGNDRMNSWNVFSGALSPTKRGAVAARGTLAAKGKPSDKYEFTTQVSSLGSDAVAGVYPVFVDKDNYISAVFDAPSRSLKVSTVQGGRTISSQSLPVDSLRTVFTDIKYSDNIEKGYLLDCPTTFDAIRISRFDVNNPEIMSGNMFNLFNPGYFTPEGKCMPIDVSNAHVADHPAFYEATFEPVTARRLTFPNKGGDTAHHIYTIRIHELFKDTYNIRATRDGDLLRIFVDNRLLASVPVPFGASNVALVAQEGTPEFHGTMFYHK